MHSLWSSINIDIIIPVLTMQLCRKCQGNWRLTFLGMGSCLPPIQIEEEEIAVEPEEEEFDLTLDFGDDDISVAGGAHVPPQV